MNTDTLVYIAVNQCFDNEILKRQFPLTGIEKRRNGADYKLHFVIDKSINKSITRWWNRLLVKTRWYCRSRAARERWRRQPTSATSVCSWISTNATVDLTQQMHSLPAAADCMFHFNLGIWARELLRVIFNERRKNVDSRRRGENRF